jgi:hypothetical protein
MEFFTKKNEIAKLHQVIHGLQDQVYRMESAFDSSKFDPEVVDLKAKVGNLKKDLAISNMHRDNWERTAKEAWAKL